MDHGEVTLPKKDFHEFDKKILLQIKIHDKDNNNTTKKSLQNLTKLLAFFGYPAPLYLQFYKKVV